MSIFTDPLLSIVIPARNIAVKISRLKDTLIACSQIECEIILILDSCTDDSKKLIDGIVSMLNLGSKIQIHCVKFGNPGSSRNFGISKAKGEWITFWDADDLPNVDKYIYMINNAFEYSEILIGQYQQVNEKNSQVLRSSNDMNTVLVAINPGVWRMIFRKTIYRNSRFSEISLAEDHNFLSNMEFNKRKLQFFNIQIYKYFKHSSQLTNNIRVINDLRVAIGNSCNSLQSNSSEFNRILLVREIFAYFTRVGFNSRMKFSASLLSNLSKLGKLEIARILLVISYLPFLVIKEKLIN